MKAVIRAPRWWTETMCSNYSDSDDFQQGFGE
jgi:hypothetical protein